MNRGDRGFPAYILILIYLALASIFPDRLQYIEALFLALGLYLAAHGLGRRISRRFWPDLNSSFWFPLGLGLLLSVCTMCFVFGTGPFLFFAIWIAVAAMAIPETPILRARIPYSCLWGAPFVLIGFWSTWTPSTFFDALVYHMGLPHQYLARGIMSVIPHHLYSSFPPFEQTLNLMFACTQRDPGIKIFTVLILFHLTLVITHFVRKVHPDAKMEFSVLPILFLPGVWVLIHVVTADVLAGLFFCAGVAFLAVQTRPLSGRTVLAGALLIAFSAWTKSNVNLYIPLLAVLWISLFGLQEWKKLLQFYLLIFLLIAPLLLRNFVTLGDPLYPALWQIFPNAGWSPQQSHALQMDSFPHRAKSLADILLAPFRLAFQTNYYGSASETGIVWLTSLLLYPFAKRNRVINRILLYVFVCFLSWLFVFHNFRQFFPVFLLLYPMAAIALESFAARYSRAMVFYWILAGFVGLRLLLPIVWNYFPLIQPGQSQSEYLRRNLDYYAIAELVNQNPLKTLLLGDTRIAFFRVPVISCTAYDQNPLLLWIEKSADAKALYDRFKRHQVGYVVYNRAEMNRLVKKYNLWRPPKRDQIVLDQFLKQYTVPKVRSGEIYLLQVK